MKMSRIRQFLVAFVSVAIMSIALAAPAKAEPIGDGVWAPSHTEATQVIPLCEGPIAVAEWLYYNFSDHGRDIDNYIRRNAGILNSLARGDVNPVRGALLLGAVLVHLPSYAITDGLFHLPPTALSVLTGCGFLERIGNKPFLNVR